LLIAHALFPLLCLMCLMCLLLLCLPLLCLPLLCLLCSLRMTGRTTATPRPAGASCASNQARLPPPLLHPLADCLLSRRGWVVAAFAGWCLPCGRMAAGSKGVLPAYLLRLL
jgi:hypothetical protein